MPIAYPGINDPIRPLVRTKNGCWYSEAGASVGIDHISHTEAMSHLWAALADYANVDRCSEVVEERGHSSPRLVNDPKSSESVCSLAASLIPTETAQTTALLSLPAYATKSPQLRPAASTVDQVV